MMNGIDRMGTASGSEILAGVQIAQQRKELADFQSYMERAAARDTVSSSADTRSPMTDGSVPSSAIAADGRLPGDFISSFSSNSDSLLDKAARPSGAAANSAGTDPSHAVKQTIDKTSKLYEKSLELESYFVKIMLSSMRSTVNRTSLTGDDNSYASKMYEDMLYDEFAVSMTKNAGFGLADQIYLQLKG